MDSRLGIDDGDGRQALMENTYKASMREAVGRRGVDCRPVLVDDFR